MMFLWLWPWKGFYITRQRQEAARAKASHINPRMEAVRDLENNALCLAKLNNHLVPFWTIVIKGNCAGSSQKPISRSRARCHTQRGNSTNRHSGGCHGNRRHRRWVFLPPCTLEKRGKMNRINSIVFDSDKGSRPAVLWFLASRDSIFKK